MAAVRHERAPTTRNGFCDSGARLLFFDVHTGDPALPVAASLADLVMTWVRALESGALRYERATGLFAVDFELAAILGLPDGIV